MVVGQAIGVDVGLSKRVSAGQGHSAQPQRAGSGFGGQRIHKFGRRVVNVRGFQQQSSHHRSYIAFVDGQAQICGHDLFVVDVGDVNLNRVDVLECSTTAGVAAVVGGDGQDVGRRADHVKVRRVQQRSQRRVDIRHGAGNGQIARRIAASRNRGRSGQRHVQHAVDDLQASRHVKPVGVDIGDGNSADRRLSFFHHRLCARHRVHRSIVDSGHRRGQ